MSCTTYNSHNGSSGHNLHIMLIYFERTTTKLELTLMLTLLKDMININLVFYCNNIGTWHAV